MGPRDAPPVAQKTASSGEPDASGRAWCPGRRKGQALRNSLAFAEGGIPVSSDQGVRPSQNRLGSARPGGEVVTPYHLTPLRLSGNDFSGYFGRTVLGPLRAVIAGRGESSHDGRGP